MEQVHKKVGSAAGTVASSTGSCVGWHCWRNIRVTLNKAKELVGTTKVRIRQDDLNVFDWDLTDHDQGNFDTKATSSVGFSAGLD